VGLVLGPPGTGKTHLLSWLIAGHLWARREAGLQRRIFVTAFTRNAVGNLLEAVADRLLKHIPEAAAPLYLGAAPPVGLSDRVEALGRDGEERAASAIADGQVVLGGTIWSLFRLLTSGAIAGAEGPTAPLFDLVCIDEASQMVLGHGLMALGGLAPAGRVVVSGDDRQLPPVRALHETTLGGRELGGSLYSFLRSTDAAEFPLDETFRLNAHRTGIGGNAGLCGPSRRICSGFAAAREPPRGKDGSNVAEISATSRGISSASMLPKFRQHHLHRLRGELSRPACGEEGPNDPSSALS
jgi:hypothetical protein